MLTLHGLMFLTVSSVSPQISFPSPVWLLLASLLWLQRAQRPLEVREEKSMTVTVGVFCPCSLLYPPPHLYICFVLLQIMLETYTRGC